MAPMLDRCLNQAVDPFEGIQLYGDYIVLIVSQ